MSKIFLLFCVLLLLNLHAYSDYDLDGVEDERDKCPNTLFSELVDKNGCAIKNLQSYHNFSIMYGLNFYQTNYATLEESNTVSNLLQFDYYYKNFSFSASSSYYNASTSSFNDTGSDDSFLSVNYRYEFIKNLNLSLGLGIILPTFNSDFNNNNTDYFSSVTLGYNLDKLYLFSTYSYTFVNDDDIVDEGLLYQNTNSYTVGLGFYATNKLYLSASYNSSNSIYLGVEDIEVVSLYGFYNFDDHYFTNLSYASGLSESASDNFVSLKIGYYF